MHYVDASSIVYNLIISNIKGVPNWPSRTVTYRTTTGRLPGMHFWYGMRESPQGGMQAYT